MKLLQIGSDPDIEEAISAVFEAGLPGTTMLSTSDEDEALELVAAEAPDAVFLGSTQFLNLAPRIRAVSKTPMILLSDTPFGSEIVGALQQGVADCLVQPFGPRELLARTRAVIQQAQAVVPRQRWSLPPHQRSIYGLRRSELKVEELALA